MTPVEKLYQAKQLVLDVEKEMLDSHRFCPYEIAYAIKSLDDAVNFFEES
jgi:hypothetical protein